MSNLREAAQQALEAIDYLDSHPEGGIDEAETAIEALRAALAQPEPAVQPTAEDIAAIEAADALEAQAREIEALRADAARYRWLRDEDDDPVCSLRQLFTMTGKPKDVDAAVDAAMRKAVTP